MKRFLLLAVLPWLAACQSAEAPVEAGNWPQGVQAPVCPQVPKALTAHGDVRQDPYYWLNGYFYKTADSTKVLDYLKAENTYVEAMMAPSKQLQESLYQEMRARIREEDSSVPMLQDGYYYYTRTEPGKDYFVYCRKKGSLQAPEQVLLDVNSMAEGHAYYSATGFSVSPDGRYLAYGVDTLSRRQYEIRVKDLHTGKELQDRMPGTAGHAHWANDNRTLYYVANNAQTLLSEKVKEHVLGRPAAQDEVVYTETDNTNYLRMSKTRSGRYILLSSEATTSSETRYVDADHPELGMRVFQPREKDVLYQVEHQGDRFLVVTNKDAKNFKVMETPVATTEAKYWRSLIPHRADVLVEDVDAFKDFLVVVERKQGLLQLRVRHLSDGKEHYVSFGEPAYDAYPTANAVYDTPVLRYGYTSLTTPSSVIDYDMATRQKTLRKEQPVNGYKKEDYVTERVWATAKDGARVPISLVYKKGTPKQAPCLLYAYGSYGNSTDAAFRSSVVSLLDRGFVYAIAHIRGGQEMGRHWYEQGKLQHKMNTFTDFIACAEYLADAKYADKEHIYAQGGSAGGLLMGAIANLRPELWRGVIAQVPFVDVVTTMSDANIPLTTNEYDEWGNPADQEAYFYMKSYSPYDNVEKKAYPNILVTTGLHDSQVQYFEPAKWVARLRERKTDKNVLLFKTNMAAGHGGSSGRFKSLEDLSLIYAFILNLEGKGKGA